LNYYRCILSIVLFLVTSLKGFTQEPIYKHFGVDEGLPSSEIYDVYQDKEGYIWFATDKGLSRYNGYEFKNFNTNDGLPGNVVLHFYPQENGQIWCYTFHNKTLFYFNEKFNGFTIYEHNDLLASTLNRNSAVKSIFIDSLNSLHIGGARINGELIISKNGNLNRRYDSNSYFDTSIKRKIVLRNKQAPQESDFHFTTLKTNTTHSNFSKEIDKSEHIQGEWIITNKKAVFMNYKEVQIVNSNNENNVLIKNDHGVLGIKVIDSTRFFVGYYFGGAKIVNTRGKIEKEFLKNKSVTNFLIDHEGGYWFTTLNSGVFYVKAPSVTAYKDESVNTNPHISSLSKNNKKELLVGYQNGDFAKIIAGKKGIYNKSTKFTVPTLVEYNETQNNGYVSKQRTIKNLNNDKVFIDSIYVIKLSELTYNNSVFAAVNGGYLNVLKGKSEKTPFRTQDICIWKKDTLLATPHGVYKKTNKEIIALSNKSELLKYRSDDIDIKNSKGDFVIATQGAGVVVYNNDAIYNISEKNGLTSNIVNEVHVENDSVVWACTNKGVNRIIFSNENNYTLTTINKDNGLLSNEVKDIEIINDTLWVGTKEGLCYIPKKIFSKIDLSDIYFKLKEIRVNDTVYLANKRLKLNYNENIVSFEIEGISFSKNNNLEYQYRLKGVGSGWYTAKNRNISFPALSPGKYVFQAKACFDKTNCSEKIIEYNFLIKPPFWKTGWFYTLCFLVVIGLVYVFFKIRVLAYNKDVVRELIRIVIKRLKRKEKFISIRTNGEDVKFNAHDLLYVKSADNYVDIITVNRIYTIRHKIGEFIQLCPDPLEYLRVHRSYIIRIDQVTSKGKSWVMINDEKIPIGKTYLTQLNKIQF